MSDTLRALLDGAIDYAGLFPPAALDMSTAVARYAAYRRGPDAWALGRFVVPMVRLNECALAMRGHAPDAPDPGAWRLAAIGGSDAAIDARTIAAFNEKHDDYGTPAARIDVYETRAADVAGIERLLTRLPAGVTGYIEVPLDPDPAPLINAIVARGGRPKARTGGTEPAAFPAPALVARFLAACAAAGTPFKVTAGLHHPRRGSYPVTDELGAPDATMFGFLNVMAAAHAAAAGATASELERVLADPAVEPSPSRGALAGFGSCSFDEPLGDLRALGVLAA